MTFCIATASRVSSNGFSTVELQSNGSRRRGILCRVSVQTIRRDGDSSCATSWEVPVATAETVRRCDADGVETPPSRRRYYSTLA